MHGKAVNKNMLYFMAYVLLFGDSHLKIGKNIFGNISIMVYISKNFASEGVTRQKDSTHNTVHDR